MCRFLLGHYKVKGKWRYLYRAMTRDGDTIDFYLSHTRNAKAAKRFFKKALKVQKHWIPLKINTDKNPALAQALTELKAEDERYQDIQHTKVKYLNNRIEGDHS